MPGIPVLDIDKRNLGDNFLCEYCGSLLRDATRASCGHFFCRSCVDNRFRKNPGGVSYCPKTMRPLFYYEFSPAEDKVCDELHNLTVHCLFLSVGCSWTGTPHNFEDHVGICDFASFSHGKGMKQSKEIENTCKTHDGNPIEVNSKQIHNEVSTPEAGIMTLSNDALKVCCVYPDCSMLVADLYEHLTGNECVHGQQLEKCKFCKLQLNPGSAIELHYHECPAFPVVLGKCGKDGNHQGKKEEFNNTLPFSRKLNLLPAYNEVGATEQIAPSVKELTAGNAVIQSTSSYYSHEQRLNNIENKLAQYDLLVDENFRLKQDVQRLAEAFLDLKSKVDHIEQGLANALQQIDYDNFLGSLNALNIEQKNLKAQLNRLLENPLSREEQGRLIRHMEAMQERIRRLEQHLLSHRNMLTDISNSVQSLANAVTSDRLPGVDILPV